MIIFSDLNNGSRALAQVVSTLTSPSIVSFKTLGSDWTVEALLDAVAEAACRGECQALIDTGALVTGLTNKEVAEHLLGLKKRGELRDGGELESFGLWCEVLERVLES